MHRARGAIARAAIAFGIALAQPASAQLPDAETLLRDLGFGADEISRVKAGEFVEGSISLSNQRELVATIAFLVQTSPTELVNQLREDLLDLVDPNTITYAVVEGTLSLASLAKLSLQPDAQKRAKAYTEARPGEDLNLSPQEIAAFHALGAAPAPADVETAVKRALLARLQAYQAQGLGRIAPYARSGGKTRSPGEDLRFGARISLREGQGHREAGRELRRPDPRELAPYSTTIVPRSFGSGLTPVSPQPVPMTRIS